jgi:hypothetical protein
VQVALLLEQAQAGGPAWVPAAAQLLLDRFVDRRYEARRDAGYAARVEAIVGG